MPCHEIAGTIVESKNPDYVVGQRAIVLTERNAAGEISSGGLAELISTSRVIPIPDYGGTDEWIMCQPSGTVLYSARRWGTTDDKRIAVLGQGAIGLSFTMIAANQGAQEDADQNGPDGVDYPGPVEFPAGVNQDVDLVRPVGDVESSSEVHEVERYVPGGIGTQQEHYPER